MYLRKSPDGYLQVLDGIERKTLVYGEKTLLCEFRLQRGAVLPRHSHPHEQTGYLLSGRMELSIGAQTMLMNPGDSWCIAGGVEHHAVALEDSLALEVFAPVREDYLA